MKARDRTIAHTLAIQGSRFSNNLRDENRDCLRNLRNSYLLLPRPSAQHPTDGRQIWKPAISVGFRINVQLKDVKGKGFNWLQPLECCLLIRW